MITHICQQVMLSFSEKATSLRESSHIDTIQRNDLSKILFIFCQRSLSQQTLWNCGLYDNQNTVCQNKSIFDSIRCKFVINHPEFRSRKETQTVSKMDKELLKEREKFKSSFNKVHTDGPKFAKRPSDAGASSSSSSKKSKPDKGVVF